MPRRAAASATPATPTPLTDSTHNQQLDDPFSPQVSLLRRQWKWAAFSQFFYTFATLFALPDVSLNVRHLLKSRSFSRLVRDLSRHIHPLTHSCPPLGHRGRFDAVYLHRHSPSGPPFARSSNSGPKIVVRIVDSFTCSNIPDSAPTSGWRTGKRLYENSTRNVTLISTQLDRSPSSNSQLPRQIRPLAMTMANTRRSLCLFRVLRRILSMAIHLKPTPWAMMTTQLSPLARRTPLMRLNSTR